MSTTTPPQSDRDRLPVDCFKDAAPFMRRPFTPAAVKFKVQATWPKEHPSGGLIVTYIDARLVVERLNLIIPHLWHDEYKLVGNGQMWCALTVDGITRYDIGEGNGKGLVSDALKRAAVKFGIGVSLYAMPKIMLNVSDGHLERRSSRGQATLALTRDGEARARALYVAWLDSQGITAFGEPFDHGDVEPVTGDVESEPSNDAPELAGQGAISPDAQISDATLDELVSVKAEAKLPDTGEAREWVREQLAAVGMQEVPQRVTVSTLKRLTEQQGSDLVDVFRDVIEKSQNGGQS